MKREIELSFLLLIIVLPHKGFYLLQIKLNGEYVSRKIIID